MPHVIPRAEAPRACRDRRRRAGRAGGGPRRRRARPRCGAARGDAVGGRAAQSRGAQPAAARTCWGSSSGASTSCERLGVDVRVRHVRRRRARLVDCSPTSSSSPPAACRSTPSSRRARSWWSRRWDVLGGDVTPRGDVLLFDDNGTHSAMSAAEMIARSGADLEIVTPERMFGVEIGGLNHGAVRRGRSTSPTPASRLHQRVLAVRRVEGRVGGRDRQRAIAPIDTRRSSTAVVVDHGTSPIDELYFDLRSGSCQRRRGRLRGTDGGPPAVTRAHPEGYQLFRIGDAVAARNIHAAVYDALRLCKDL